MKVQFLGGYRGWATEEVYFANGEETEVTPYIAEYLEKVGFAKVVDKKRQTPNATPKAVELATEGGIPLDEIEGTGADGRVLVEDIRAYIDARYTTT